MTHFIKLLMYMRKRNASILHHGISYVIHCLDKFAHIIYTISHCTVKIFQIGAIFCGLKTYYMCKRKKDLSKEIFK